MFCFGTGPRLESRRQDFCQQRRRQVWTTHVDTIGLYSQNIKWNQHSFADVNLSEDGVRIGSPGAGGWPTFRHFNKETGPEGAPYTDLKKTDQAMCDEMKQDK